MLDDKVFWRQLADKGYALPPNHTTASLTPFLLQTLGSPDPEWRDDIGYMTFVTWVDEGLYPTVELLALIDPLLANLKIGLGERGTDLVLLRSFSALWLSVIVYQDNEEPFLDAETIQTIAERTIAYFLAEVDVRGYVEGKGWLHAVAHTGDLLSFLARSPHSDAARLTAILDAIGAKLGRFRPDAYTHAEDQRLAKVVISALKRELLTADYWQGWLQRLVEIAKQGYPDGFTLDRYYTYQNIRAFLQSVYFSLALAESPLPLGDTLQASIKEAVRAFGY
ncbi:MAG: DUF2785 domain-containing protein [Anaerolineales bacterium]|nr:DUF2785 domain-containing protein [Anaerolineales bacterium]